MLKLGEIREVSKKVRMWGGYIEQVWLAKWMPTGEYQLLGLVRLDNGNANGWCTLKQGSLKECRAAVARY